MAWDKNSQEGQFITGLDAERVIVNEMRKKVTKRKCFAILKTFKNDEINADKE